MLRKVFGYIVLLSLVAPDIAFAAAGGGTMPYSTALTTLRTSFTGEVAGIICLVAVIGGLAYFILNGETGHVMSALVKVVILCGCIGLATTFIDSAIGVAGAIV